MEARQGRWTTLGQVHFKLSSASSWYDDQDQQREQPRKHLSTSFNCVPDTFSDCQTEQIERTTKQEVLNSEALVLVELGGKHLKKCRGCPKCRSWVESRATGTCLDLGMKDIQAWQVWPSVEISVAFLVLQKSPKLPQTGRSPKCCQDHSKKAHEAERPWLFTVGHPGYFIRSLFSAKNIATIKTRRRISLYNNFTIWLKWGSHMFQWDIYGLLMGYDRCR